MYPRHLIFPFPKVVPSKVQDVFAFNFFRPAAKSLQSSLHVPWPGGIPSRSTLPVSLALEHGIMQHRLLGVDAKIASQDEIYTLKEWLRA